ncbi:hypothetical protein V1514DRAFT_335769 [Lipomyces japonicus]|uniref:uncharacterized protein n=1 Tax=Lipomyces japonicus TaxID=56871 RepID=UPI0034CD0299
MATYEDDHNLSNQSRNVSNRHAERQTLMNIRPDLASFFSSDRASVANEQTYRSLASAFTEIGDSPLLEQLSRQLLDDAIHLPSDPNGVNQQFLDSLERISKKKLKADDNCAICNTAYLDDAYPLVVRLPCNRLHHFDLECIAPWLKLHATCPLCRKDLLEKKKIEVVVNDEEEYDDTYG